MGRLSSPSRREEGSGEKQTRERKAQWISEHTERQEDMDMKSEDYRPMGTELPILTKLAPTEVIPKTQLHHLSNNGKVYMEILASIGLDSPTPSQEIRGNTLIEGQEGPQVNTSIRHSVASLMALGKHVFTPRQGRLWKHRNKSPLGN